MAQRSKNTKKSAPKKGASRAKKAANQNTKAGMSYSTLALILFFAAVLIGVFTYLKTDAVVAVFFHDILYGLLAKTAILVPLAILGLGVYLIKTREKDTLIKKSITVLLFLVSIAGLIHILSSKQIPFTELYGYGTSGVGGGFLGGSIALLLENTIGKTAAIIVLIFALIILTSLILKVSLVSVVTEFVSGFFEKSKEEQKEKKPAKKVKTEVVPQKVVLSSSDLDFAIGDDEPKKKQRRKQKTEDAEEENVIFTPDPNDPIETQKRGEETAKKAEKVSPITKAERDKIHSEIEGAIEKEIREYKFPPYSLLKAGKPMSADKRQEMRETAQKLMEVLSDFNVEAKLLQVTQGPTVTRYEIQPETGVKLSKITGLAEDIAWKLAVPTVLVAAVPGKAAVGIEVPNNSVLTVTAREILESPAFSSAESKLAVAFGKDIGGNVIVGDIAKMPHVLIAGSTGSGKSVCINTIITSILYKATPEEVKLIMVDPKVVELGVYNGIPHLLIPVVTDPKRAAGALNWAVQEMMKRYSLFAESHVRNLEGYNKNQKKLGEQTLPKIVIIIDELADLMMVAAKEVEDSICRLAQLARAAGIHLIVATQRPSVDVITGLIKANVPSRIAFAVSSQIDSRTILDRGGAEKLLGKGDMLYYPAGLNSPVRVQGAFVSDGEIEKIVDYVKANCEETHYSEDLAEHIERCQTGENGVTDEDDAEDADALLPQAIELAMELGQISTAMIQRRLKVGYARAGRIIDQMEMRGIISGANGSKPREVYVNRINIDNLSD